MITYRTGDLLESAEPVIAHGVNTKGAFGAGIAGQIARKWPEVREAYIEAVNDGSMKLGTAQLVPLLNENRYVYNLATQRNPGADASTWAIGLAFGNLIESCRYYNINRVAIPRIGCGIGGLVWDQVQAEITDVLIRSGSTLQIVVYDLP